MIEFVRGSLAAAGRHALWDGLSKEAFARKRQQTPLNQLILTKREPGDVATSLAEH